MSNTDTQMDTDMDTEMRVMKRDGTLETVAFDKILNRIKTLGTVGYLSNVSKHDHSNEVQSELKINYTALVMKVIDQLYDKISTTKIDELSAQQCASMGSVHPDYNTLAGRIIISNHQKNTSDSFVVVMTQLYDYMDKHGKQSPLISEELFQIASTHGEELEQMCNHSRDFLIDYFGFKTLERAYLMKINGKSVERIQHMMLRVAVGIHGANMEKVRETYNYMSCKYFTHATPTLFNAGTPHPQLSSCYLIAMEGDSVDGIYNTLKDCALISKWAGGIGLHIHNVRAAGSHIRGTNGTSNGIVPMLKVFNNTAKYIDQCVHPETIIYTTQGPKQIQHCIVGETEIINQLGETEVIQNVLEHSYQGEILEIKTDFVYTNKLTITPQHPIYILRDNEKQWIDAGELFLTDKIIYSIPTYENDISNITKDDCHLYGYIMRYGSIENGNYNIQNNINIDVDFIKKYLDSKFVEYNFIDNKYFTWNPSLQLPFRYSDFYNESNQKRIHSRWLNLSLDKIKVLSYIFDDLEYKHDIESQVNYLRLRLCKESLPPRLEYIDDNKQFVCTNIESISKNTYNGILYDLQMKKQHDYLLETGLVHNGGGRRNGSFAIYLEPWHADIEIFLQMRKNHGDEELKARDLFYALWIPDLFMERVKANGKWTLMCPDECPGLSDVYGEEFNALYTKYEAENRGRISINARDLWFQILDAQMETGTPYLLYKDAVNKKSNQKNIGIIKSSNLCCEVVQYSDDKETAVCNLASIALPMFVDANGEMDYNKLHEVAKVVAGNLNRIINVNYYPTPKTRLSNMRHRPIGIGVQGLADVFMLMNIPFHSEEAKKINRDIFETIYHAALERSCELAIEEGPYETFAGSPASQGLLQFDMWNVEPGNERYNWDELKECIKIHGLRNSLLLAPMPTASTSQILGFNECIEPITSNIYSRRTLAGEFILTNKYLMNDLLKLDLWNEKIKNNIISNNGSVQQIEVIPQEIRDKYKTIWEIPMRHLIDMSADRGAFICQSQSLNLWLEDPNYNTLTSMHFYSWSKGLKTGIYYLRRRARFQAQQFTIEPEKNNNAHNNNEQDEICEMCSA
jgi:ribonucleoside-diphosphate reductase alpha subunit